MNIGDKWKSFTVFHKTLVLACAGLLLTAIVLGYGAYRSQIAAREASIRSEHTIGQVQNLERQVAKPVPVPDLSVVGRAIPNEWEMARFFADLAVAAKTCNVAVVSVVPTQPPEERGAHASAKSQAESGTPPSKPSNAVPAASTADQKNGSDADPQPGREISPRPKASAGQGGPSGSGGGGGDGASKSRGAAPPPAIPGLHTLELSLEAEGSGADLLAFLDELQAMPRFVWIDEYTLEFPKEPQNPEPSKLNVKLTIYARAPWDAKAANEAPWPFPIQPAGNSKAFGRQ